VIEGGVMATRPTRNRGGRRLVYDKNRSLRGREKSRKQREKKKNLKEKNPGRSGRRAGPTGKYRVGSY